MYVHSSCMHTDARMHDSETYVQYSHPQKDAEKCFQDGFSTVYPLVMTNIAMENGPFIDGLPIKNGDFPWLC
jgi:hypothetical protein